MQQKGSLVFSDGTKYACDYMTNGDHVQGTVTDDLPHKRFEDALPQLERADGTLSSFKGMFDFIAQRSAENQQTLVVKFNGRI